jgi:N-methylhydantoinase A/oxoprolinase/acetone carboxylase beta subunit
LSEKQIRNECVKIRELGISDIALVGVFSPLDTTGRQEEKAKVIILEEIPGADVVLSKDSTPPYFVSSCLELTVRLKVGNIGFLERENASILNASIIKFARKTIAGFVTAMKSLGLSSCPLLLTQNDGTLIDTETAKRCPIRTFSSGPTNSMSGASYLADLVSESKGRQVIVADIGGTTTDICAL